MNKSPGLATSNSVHRYQEIVENETVTPVIKDEGSLEQPNEHE